MNNERRKEIAKLAELLSDMTAKLDDIKSELETFAEEEQEKFDNLSEGLQASERGQSYEAAAGALQETVYNVESAISEIEQALSSLETAGE